ncbi:glycosyltransferase family 4 protein [Halarcobacter anaerophilus]|uniref:Glycosyl transferase n=1 Tax=Halarcobacter anaerophilus TaxID=877500 RepID=A0A4Q0Y3P7_9BACT|nr:glycosyltransferase family 4 protein [Halarcobacter anaerophilus]QDF29535.1 glycosyltransferase, family 1 [Halarcobacter anaerophilus]RXJ64772.1 glycosyl transferase [Halarcobacter anaerophilus]
MKSKKILEVCLSPDLGGLELYMSRCSNELSKEFELFCVVSKSSKLKDYLDNALEVFELKRKSSFSLLSSLKLAKIIDEKGIDIVHLHWTKDIPIVVFAKIFSKRKPKIVQTRHMTMTRFKDDFYHKFLYKNIDTIICVTKTLEQQIEMFIPKKIRPETKTLYLGAENAEFFSKEEIQSFKDKFKIKDSFMISLIGRINEFKGQHLLIDAIKELKRKNLNIKAYIIGHAMSQEYLDKLKQKVTNDKLNELITFVGFSKEVNKFMQACDVVLMTSKNETFGLVTIEAMKNQTAVIASNSGGSLEIVENEKTGLLFKSEDSHDLALKIEKLYDNPDFKNYLAKNGKNRADELFDEKKQFVKLCKLFETI